MGAAALQVIAAGKPPGYAAFSACLKLGDLLVLASPNIFISRHAAWGFDKNFRRYIAHIMRNQRPPDNSLAWLRCCAGQQGSSIGHPRSEVSTLAAGQLITTNLRPEQP
jgi:hypothetical protein